MSFPDRHAAAPVTPAVMLAVAIGGVLGTAARYGVGRLMPSADAVIPWSTLLVNVSGSFALGVVAGLLAHRPYAPEWVRPLLATGVLGSYTTYSTFAVETNDLLMTGPLLAAAYLVASVGGGVAAAMAGLRVVRR